MSTKKLQIKTKKANLVIFRDDYICINGIYLVHKDYCELDNDLMRFKIENNLPFIFQNGEYREPAEKEYKLTSLFPSTNEGMTELTDFELIDVSSNKEAEYRVYRNNDSICYAFIDNEIIKALRKQNAIEIKFYQKCKNSLCAIYNKEGMFVFGIMPTIVRNSYFEGK